MKTFKYSTIISSAIIFLLITGSSCNDESGNTVVGTTQGNTDINYVSFTVTELEVSSSSLKASGTVKNNGNKTITSPWYVEAQFYTDSTLSLKLGGNRTQIGVPLEAGVQTIWSITFSDPDIAEGNYPNFRVSNFRAYYNN